MTNAPPPKFDHLLRMTDQRGTFEHAKLTEPRREHGYCTDDMARVLVVSTREPHPGRAITDLVVLSMRFLGDAQSVDGKYRNRMDDHGRWTDRPALEDCWGRSLWALGTAASHADDDWVRQVAVAQFERAAPRRSPWTRAMCFAAIGAAELLVAKPDHRGARALLADAANLLQGLDDGPPWPEPTLTYANAVIPEAMIAAGSVLDIPRLQARGLALLGWLLDHETIDGHLSVTPAGGSPPEAARPGFDQQPIEVAALADACARAASIDASNHAWADGVARAVAWFLGDNDGRRVMWDPATGGGFDGLEAGGVNANQGTESTLAVLSTLQHARHLVTT